MSVFGGKKTVCLTEKLNNKDIEDISKLITEGKILPAIEKLAHFANFPRLSAVLTKDTRKGKSLYILKVLTELDKRNL